MLLTLTATPPAGAASGDTAAVRSAMDLGYLLHKNPARVQEFELSFGKAHVFYPEASDERCTAALLLEVDPVALVRGRAGSGEGGLLQQYVNDRPYAASSFLSSAVSQVFGTALSGRCKARPELPEQAMPLEAHLPTVPCRGGEGFLRALWEPLGYAVEARPVPLDPDHPEWGASAYFSLTLRAECRLQDLLSHLYVLIPVLDDEKHYWVSTDEVEKLLRHGEGWLAGHPQKETITRRYLRRRWSLIRDALSRLVEEETPQAEAAEEAQAEEEAVVERRVSLNQQRMAAVLSVLKESGAKRVLDLGCGEGTLLRELLEDRQFTEIVGLDVSYRTLEMAKDRLKLERRPAHQQERIKLLHGALTYRDQRIAGYDAAAVVEVIEHLDPPRLAAFERVLFGCARPGTVVLSTPNAEYNVRWPSLPAGRFRHRDHRFEWSREELRAWAERVAERHGYRVEFRPVGVEDAEVGSPTQMAVFTLAVSEVPQGMVEGTVGVS